MCSDNDVFLTFWERVLRGNDVIGKCGVEDGSTVNVMERLRCGGRHQKQEELERSRRPEGHVEERKWSNSPRRQDFRMSS